MKRLTTDTPDGNFETMLNFVFGKDGWAHIRQDSEEGSVPLTQWAKAQCILHGCGEFSAETPQEIDEEISDCMMDFPDCPIALAYCFASQAVHLRSRLKSYEDVLFAEDGTEQLTLDDLRGLVVSNEPLTLDELKKLAKDKPVAVWSVCYAQDNGGELRQPKRLDWESGEWLMFDGRYFIGDGLLDSTREYGRMFVAYRNKPKEAAT